MEENKQSKGKKNKEAIKISLSTAILLIIVFIIIMIIFVFILNKICTKDNTKNVENSMNSTVTSSNKNTTSTKDSTHDHRYILITNLDGNNFDTTLDANHIYRCEVCGDEYTEKHEFGEWNAINNNTAWTLWCEKCNQYVYTEDYNVVKNSGYPIKGENNVDEAEVEPEKEVINENKQQKCENNKHRYVLVTNKNRDDYSTTLDGVHVYKCSVCDDEYTEKHDFDAWYSIYDDTAWTLWCKKCRQYVYTNDYSVVENSGYGLKSETEHQHKYSIITNKDGRDAHTTLDGMHTYKCSSCGDEYSVKHNFDKWYTLYDGTAWSLWCQNCKQYVYTNDYSVVENSGYGLY